AIRFSFCVSSFPDINHGGKSSKSGARMHHDSSRKIKNAPLGQQSSAPNHVHERIVYEQLPHHKKNDIRSECNTIDEGTGDERGRDNGEHHLIRHENKLRHFRISAERRLECNTVHECFIEIADHTAFAATETE